MALVGRTCNDMRWAEKSSDLSERVVTQSCPLPPLQPTDRTQKKQWSICRQGATHLMASAPEMKGEVHSIRPVAGA